MTDIPEWLPPLVLFDEYGGDWDTYLHVVYDWFRNDFVESTPRFRGQRIGLKRHPTTDGKEWTFWHIVQEGTTEEDRRPDLRRCERIRWPRPVIDYHDDDGIKVWRNRRGTDKRICLLFEQESYLVVLADRGKYILLWTAYLVERPHRRRKLLKEYEEYQRTKGQNG